MKNEVQKGEAGSEILRCSPFAYVVAIHFKRSSVCDFCLSTDEGNDPQASGSKLKCARCKVTFYCDKKCQTKGWKDIHKHECKLLAQMWSGSMPEPLPFNTMQLVLRIILRLRTGGNRVIATLPDGRKRHFDDLVDHRRKVIASEARLEGFKMIFKQLKSVFGKLDMIFPTSDEVMDIYARVLINSFNIMDDSQRAVGIGLYLEASVLDHSCRPNAAVVFEGRDLIVRSIGHNVTLANARISYAELMEEIEVRREILQDRYYFTCNCDGCVSESAIREDALKKACLRCPSCTGPVPLQSESEENVVCVECSKEVPQSKISAFWTSKKRIVELHETGCYEGAPLSDLHYYDRDHSKVVDILMDRAAISSQWPLAAEYGKQLLPAMRRFLPEYDVNTALVLHKMGRLSMCNDNLDDAELYLMEALKIHRVLYGHSHKLCEDAAEALSELLLAGSKRVRNRPMPNGDTPNLKADRELFKSA